MTTPRLTLVAAAGGALGAVLRWLLSYPPDSDTVLWATVAINVVGCGLLAALPAIESIRRSRWLPTFLGTGVLGGFTTMSAAVVLPLADLTYAAAAAYVCATLAACLTTAHLVARLVDHLVVRRLRGPA